MYLFFQARLFCLVFVYFLFFGCETISSNVLSFLNEDFQNGWHLKTSVLKNFTCLGFSFLFLLFNCNVTKLPVISHVRAKIQEPTDQSRQQIWGVSLQKGSTVAKFHFHLGVRQFNTKLNSVVSTAWFTTAKSFAGI